MARKIDKVNLAVTLFPNGTGGFDFVVMNAEPHISHSDAPSNFDKAKRREAWFDFSQVTAGQPYENAAGEVIGRKIGPNVTVSQIEQGVINEVKAQSGM